MLELIDQSTPTRLIFRCASCHVVGLSSFSRADEHYFWHATPRGPTEGRWLLHQCDPKDIAAAQQKVAAEAKAASDEAARLASLQERGIRLKDKHDHAAWKEVDAIAPEPEKAEPAKRKPGRPKKEAVAEA